MTSISYSTLNFGKAYLWACGVPQASSDDIKAWNKLQFGPTGTKSTIAAGLFSYDITCMKDLCATESDKHGYCALIEVLGIDGFAMGMYASMDKNTVFAPYAFGFRDVGHGDHYVAFDSLAESNNFWLRNNYSVTDKIFANTPIRTSINPYYGFSRWAFY